MKGLLKWLVIAGVITAAIVILTNKSRERATAPAGPAPKWEPPTVAPQGPEPEVSAAEAEGMTASEAPAEDVALDATGAEVVSEFAAEPMTTAVPEQPEPEAEALAVAADEGMAPPAEAPAEDIAVGSGGFPVVSELAAADAELALEEEFLDAIEREAAEERPSAEIAVTAEPSGESTTAEPAHPVGDAGQAATSAEAALPDFGAMLDEAVADVDAEMAPVEAVAPVDLEAKDPDFLTKYFEELAATPDEPESAVTEAAAAESEAGGDEALLASVEEALEDLEPAPIVPPPRRTAESFLDEGNVYFNVGQYGLAVERYTQAIEMDRELTAAFYNRANAHTRAGDFENALADYNRALELQPRDADALNNRGMLHLYRSNFPAALADFNGALEADPTDTTVMVNRGLAHLHGGNSAAALVDFREAATKDNSDAAAQYGAAQASASLGNRDEAMKHVTRALELDPAYAREAAADPRLALLQGDEEFLKLLRQSGSRQG